MKRYSLILILTLLLSIALCGCTGDKVSEETTITIGIAQDIEDSLDPHYAAAAGTREILFNIFDGLLKPNSNGELEPAVCESVESSEDGTSYTFVLREGVTFHNGEKVTAGDVIASIEKCAGKDGSDPLIPAFVNIKSIEEADVNGKAAVKIILSEPTIEFLSNMTCAILPAKYLDASTEPIGCGPYMYVSRSPQENIILQRYDGYYGTMPEIKNVTLKIVANPDTIVMNLEGGAIDMFARVTSAQMAQLSDKFNIIEGNMNLVQALYLNNAAKPLDNVLVRQALCYATDAREIMDYISEGKGTPIGSAMFPAFGKYYDDTLAAKYERNIEKAKELLDAAGYPDGFDLEITVPSNYEQHIDTAQVLVDQLKAINVNATINLVEWNTWLSDVYAGRNYQSTVIGVDASTLSGRALLERYVSTNSGNFMNFADEEYDKYFQELLANPSDENTIATYAECQKILAEQAASVFIQDMPEFVALNSKYEGYEFYPLYALDISKIRYAKN